MSAHLPDKENTVFAIARNIDHTLNGAGTAHDERKWGFALLVYPFGDQPTHANVNYIGSGQRDDVMKAMKAIMERWELPV